MTRRPIGCWLCRRPPVPSSVTPLRRIPLSLEVGHDGQQGEVGAIKPGVADGNGAANSALGMDEPPMQMFVGINQAGGELELIDLERSPGVDLDEVNGYPLRAKAGWSHERELTEIIVVQLEGCSRALRSPCHRVPFPVRGEIGLSLLSLANARNVQVSRRDSLWNRGT